MEKKTNSEQSIKIDKKNEEEYEKSSLLLRPLRVQFNETLGVLEDRLTRRERFFYGKETRCKLAYYFLGIVSLVINIVVTSLTATYATECEDGQLVFILSIVVATTTSACNFLQIETKITKYSKVYKEYHDIRMDCARFKTHDRTPIEFNEKIKYFMKKEREIDYNAPEDNYGCCGC